MTNIDLKRLAVDREYWPKEAEAFFYMPKGVFKPFFAKSAKHSDFSVEGMSGGWIGEKLDGESYHVFSECWEMIPRPTKKAQEVEWVGGLPPVGAVCEVKGAVENWAKCKIVGHHNGKAVFFCDHWVSESDYDALPASEFRPIRTKKQQRQREELAALCDDYIKRDYYGHNLADAILSKYNLEPKP
jgi:hypothetical protein